MSTAVYNIDFINERTIAGNYSVFTAPPIVNNGVTVYTNSWMAFPVAPSGNFKIEVSMNFYAWIGTTPLAPAPGVVVSTGQTAPVTLGTTSIPMVVKDGNNSFDLPNITATAHAGSFSIVTGKDFSVPNKKYMIGLAQKDKNAIIAPTASIMANNNTTTSITPVVRFFIGEFDYTAGTVVSFAESSAVSGKIDFSSGEGLGLSRAIVRHEATGNFKVDYVPK